jgi:GTPase
LVNAFRATLEELHEADLLLHIVDGSDDQQSHHMLAVERVLDELGVIDTPRLLVFNKCEGSIGPALSRTAMAGAVASRAIRVSALTGEGCAELVTEVQSRLQRPRIATSA